MRYLRLLLVTILMCGALVGCQGDPAIHRSPSATPQRTDPAIAPLVGTWEAKLKAGLFSLHVYADGTFMSNDRASLAGHLDLPLQFTGHVEPVGGRVYRYVATVQGGKTLSPTGNSLTLTLSADGKELSYVVGGIRTTYHRVSDQ